jgi:hypothetical protein
MYALSTLPLAQMRAVGKVNSVGNQSTLEQPDGQVISCQPDGTLALRPNGTAGAYELCTVTGSIAVYNPMGSQPFAYALVPV